MYGRKSQSLQARMRTASRVVGKMVVGVLISLAVVFTYVGAERAGEPRAEVHHAA